MIRKLVFCLFLAGGVGTLAGEPAQTAEFTINGSILVQNRIQTATQQVKVECWVCATTTCSSGGPTIGYGNSEWTPSFNAELQNYPEPAQIIFSVGVNTGQTFTSNTGTDQFTTTTIDTSTAHPWDANSYACRLAAVRANVQC